MPITVLGGTKVADTAFSVANSCRFNDGDSPSLHKSFSSASRTTYTFSAWIKLGTPGVSGSLFYRHVDDNNYCRCFFESDVLKFADVTSGADNWLLITTRKFRDHTAWYHIVVVCDTTNATAGNRQRIYVNGIEETVFSTETNSSTQGQWGVDGNHYVGTKAGSAYFFDGYMAEVCYIDGTALTPTSFGEFDDDSPNMWKPKDVSGLTFGTNGFYLDFEDSSNLGNDANGGTDLTEANLAAADQAVDSPTNNFCTLNPLHSMAQSASTNNTTTYSEGNCKIAPSDNNSMIHTCNTLAMPPKGKWYMELKFLSTNVSYGGIIDIDTVANASRANVDLSSSSTSGYNQVVYQTNYIFAGTSTSYGDDLSTNDIMGIAFDADNGALYIALNGTWQNSGDPTSGASKTNAIDISGESWYAGVQGWSICIGDGSTSNGDTYEVSFGGCPGFAVSSAQADDNGYGIFEHDVPAGYYAICTKNLAEFGG